jgi:transposase
MSAQAFYRALGLNGYDVIDCHETPDEISIIVELPRHKWRCPECSSRRVQLHEWKFRRWLNAPIGLKLTSVGMSVPRVKCLNCGARKRIPVKFAMERAQHTLAYERYAASLLQHMTPHDFARREGIAWGTAAAIDQRRLAAVPKPSLRRLKRIAIDEIYAGKLHKFLSLVLDLDSGAVVFVGAGRGSAALRPFFEKLQKTRAKVQAVSIDMAGGYIKAVEENLPQATLVFDRFHIVKLMNEKLTQLRREQYNLAQDMQMKAVLKGIRWLLLMNGDPPTPKGKPIRRLGQGKIGMEQRRLADLSRLRAALELNLPLSTAYIMKEELRMLWSFGSKADADEYLQNWCRRPDVSAIGVLKTMAQTLRKYARQILNWYDERISSGPLEGTNNKIKLLQRRAYGYRNRNHFILRIETLHTTKVRLVG